MKMGRPVDPSVQPLTLQSVSAALAAAADPASTTRASKPEAMVFMFVLLQGRHRDAQVARRSRTMGALASPRRGSSG